MANKVNMIKKSSIHGQQMVFFNPKDHDLIGTNETEGIDSIIQDKLNEGHSILHNGDEEFYIVYASKKTDGFTRTVTTENFHKKQALNVFETSHAKWSDNVDMWFDLALQDEDIKAEINAIAAEALALPPINGNAPFDLTIKFGKFEPEHPHYMLSGREWLKRQGDERVGKSGSRRQKPWDFMCGNGKDRFKKPGAWLKKAVENYVWKNTPNHKKKW